MVMNIFNTSIQGIYFVLLIVFAPFCTLAVILRFIACKKAGRTYGLEDWFALSALIVYLAYTILSAINLAALDGRVQAVMAVQEPDEFARIRKMTYADLPLFPLQMLFSKLSIMALYLRIFGIRPVYRRWIYFLGAVHVAWVIMILVLQTVACNPIRKFWRPFTPGWCFSESILVIPSECINSFIDFALVILALFMIRSIHISRSTKWKLGGLFGLGGFVGVIGFVKIGLQYSPDKLYTYTSLGLWATVQMAVAIICCSAPVYKPILPAAGFWTLLKSKASTMRLYRSSREKSTDSGDVSPKLGEPHGFQQGSQSKIWIPLQEPNSNALAWPRSTHYSEFHAVGENMETANGARPAVPQGTIQVQRNFEIV